MIRIQNETKMLFSDIKKSDGKSIQNIHTHTHKQTLEEEMDLINLHKRKLNRKAITLTYGKRNYGVLIILIAEFYEKWYLYTQPHTLTYTYTSKSMWKRRRKRWNRWKWSMESNGMA